MLFVFERGNHYRKYFLYQQKYIFLIFPDMFWITKKSFIIMIFLFVLVLHLFDIWYTHLPPGCVYRPTDEATVCQCWRVREDTHDAWGSGDWLLDIAPSQHSRLMLDAVMDLAEISHLVVHKLQAHLYPAIANFQGPISQERMKNLARQSDSCWTGQLFLMVILGYPLLVLRMKWPTEMNTWCANMGVNKKIIVCLEGCTC